MPPLPFSLTRHAALTCHFHAAMMLISPFFAMPLFSSPMPFERLSLMLR